jgi:hypothetical protein
MPTNVSHRVAARWLGAKTEAETEWHVAYSLKGHHAIYGDSSHKEERGAKSASNALAKLYPNSTAVFYYERRRDTLEPMGKAVAVKGKAPRLGSVRVAARWLPAARSTPGCARWVWMATVGSVEPKAAT